MVLPAAAAEPERSTQVNIRLKNARLKDRSPHRLSDGEKKRVALASGLILDPEVLLFPLIKQKAASNAYDNCLVVIER